MELQSFEETLRLKEELNEFFEKEKERREEEESKKKRLLENLKNNCPDMIVQESESLKTGTFHNEDGVLNYFHRQGYIITSRIRKYGFIELCMFGDESYFECEERLLKEINDYRKYIKFDQAKTIPKLTLDNLKIGNNCVSQKGNYTYG